MVQNQWEGINGITIDKDIQLHQVCLLVAPKAVIERGIALGARFQLVIKVNDQFCQRHTVRQQDTLSLNVLHLLERATTRGHQVHNGTDVAGGREDRNIHPWLFDLLNRILWRKLWWIVDLHQLAVGLSDVVLHTRSRRKNIQVVLAL